MVVVYQLWVVVSMDCGFSFFVLGSGVFGFPVTFEGGFCVWCGSVVGGCGCGCGVGGFWCCAGGWGWWCGVCRWWGVFGGGGWGGCAGGGGWGGGGGVGRGLGGVVGGVVGGGVGGFEKGRGRVVDRSEDSVTWEGVGGLRLVEVSSVPGRVGSGGSWREISTDVRGRGFFSWLGRGGGEVVDHPLRPVFAERADESPVLGVTREGFRVGFSLVGGSGSRMVVESGGQGVRYPGVFPGTDLVYEVVGGGVKVLLVVEAGPGAVGRVGWEWRVDSPGLVPVVDESGRVVFSDESGRVVLVVPRAVVLDSAGTLGDRADAQGEGGVSGGRDG